ncbi:MAG: aminotransferase class I/II-fold pyridoxal phosphate-dependent enzyme [Magnetovibrionaceae bacterium]
MTVIYEPHNPLLDHLTDYPFDRLRALLGPIDPPSGREATVLSIGEPRHRPPAFLQTELTRDLSLWGKYPPVDGTPEFRAAVGGWLARRYGLQTLDADSQVLPLCGTREGLYMAAQLAMPPKIGHKPKPIVLSPNPFYQVYSGAGVMAGAEVRFLDSTAESGFLPDLDSLDDATLARTVVFYLCSPANPQGAIADEAYLARALTLARTHNFLLVVDECYAELYDRAPPPGALAEAEKTGSFNNLLVFHSLSKRSNAAGLRSGFVAGDPDLIKRFRRLRSYGGATLPVPVMAASAALWADDDHVAENRRLYREKFDLAESLMAGRFGFFRPQGGFFLWLDVEDGEAAAAALWREAAIRVLPGAYLSKDSAEGGNPGQAYIRVALVDPIDRLEPALGALVKVLSTAGG